MSKASFTRGFEPFEELLSKVMPSGPQARKRTDPNTEAGRAGRSLRAGRRRGSSSRRSCCPDPGRRLRRRGTAAGFGRTWPLLLAVPSGVAFFLGWASSATLLRHRAPGLALGGAVVGFVLCFFYYPALANQLSPKEVFESYRHVCPGVAARAARRRRRDVGVLRGRPAADAQRHAGAYNWLVGGRRASGAASR